MDRSSVMRSVKSRGTRPERIVAKIIKSTGVRIHQVKKKLPGSPDFVFVKRGKAIFVHGCFWHGHSCARGARTPVSNRQYWVAKISGNRRRDSKVRRQLRFTGWDVLTIWECELKRRGTVERRIASFLVGTRHPKAKKAIVKSTKI